MSEERMYAINIWGFRIAVVAGITVPSLLILGAIIG